MKKKIFILTLVLIFPDKLDAIQKRFSGGAPLDYQVTEEKRFANLGLGDTVLFSAVMNGWHRVVRMVLSLGKANVNAKDNFDNTPLHYAALLGECLIVETLLAYGANEDLNNKYGKTPCDLAQASHNEVEAVCGDVESFNKILHRLTWPRGIRKKIKLS